MNDRLNFQAAPFQGFRDANAGQVGFEWEDEARGPSRARSGGRSLGQGAARTMHKPSMQTTHAMTPSIKTAQGSATIFGKGTKRTGVSGQPGATQGAQAQTGVRRKTLHGQGGWPTGPGGQTGGGQPPQSWPGRPPRRGRGWGAPFAYGVPVETYPVAAQPWPTDGQPFPADAQPFGPLSSRSEYMRWVQSALNDVLGLQLPVTGVGDQGTRDAIRNFQQQQGIPADGVVGPDTERALLAARQPADPQSPGG